MEGKHRKIIAIVLIALFVIFGCGLIGYFVYRAKDTSNDISYALELDQVIDDIYGEMASSKSSIIIKSTDPTDAQLDKALVSWTQYWETSKYEPEEPHFQAKVIAWEKRFHTNAEYIQIAKEIVEPLKRREFDKKVIDSLCRRFMIMHEAKPPAHIGDVYFAISKNIESVRKVYPAEGIRYDQVKRVTIRMYVLAIQALLTKLDKILD